MKNCLSLLIVVTCLLTGCERPRFNDDITKTYSLPDRSSGYKALRTRDPAGLTEVDLYNRALTLWDTPYRELNLPTTAGTAHIIVSGPADGDPLILLHGMNANATMWYPNVKALSEHYRIYAIDDILGSGKSELSQSDASLDSLIAWYLEIFDTLKLQNINLVGASQGGWIATHLALTNPERVNKLILLSPAQTFSWFEFSMDTVSNLMYSFNPQRDGLRDHLTALSSDVEGIDQLYIDHYFRTIETATTSPLLMDMKPFNDEQLAALTMPVLFLIGDDDLLNDQESIDRAIDIMPCVQAEIIPSSGHFLTSDQPNVVNDKIIEFVDGTASEQLTFDCQSST